jgi:hypothetical protein
MTGKCVKPAEDLAGERIPYSHASSAIPRIACVTPFSHVTFCCSICSCHSSRRQIDGG